MCSTADGTCVEMCLVMARQGAAVSDIVTVTVIIMQINGQHN